MRSWGASPRLVACWAVADYVQRSPRHIASETDVERAYAVGRAAVEFASTGWNAVMRAIRRISDSPYRWDIVEAPLSAVANQEKLLPAEFISSDGFGITEPTRRYLAPLSLARRSRHSTMGFPIICGCRMRQCRNGMGELVD